MRLTKHGHAALRIDLDGHTLLVDPGVMTLPLDDLQNVVAVVLTHEHPDHWTPAHLERILDAAPGTPIFGPPGVVAAASAFDVTVVNPGDSITVAPFDLEFFGGEHAVIHSSIPVIDNVGVLVNKKLYYPGDSYALPGDAQIELLAAPVGAPWLKIGDAMDFVLAVQPKKAFGTHDATLSPFGLSMGRARLKWCVEQSGGEFFELDPGDKIDF